MKEILRAMKQAITMKYYFIVLSEENRGNMNFKESRLTVKAKNPWEAENVAKRKHPNMRLYNITRI